jgi:hypothetical protein
VFRVRRVAPTGLRLQLAQLARGVAVEQETLDTKPSIVRQSRQQVVLRFGQEGLQVIHPGRLVVRHVFRGLPQGGADQRRLLVLGILVFDRHAVGAVEHQVQQRRFYVGQRHAQHRVGQGQQQQGQQQATAQAQGEPCGARAAMLEFDVEHQGDDQQSRQSEDYPERALGCPRSRQRRSDLVDRLDVLQTE